MRGWEKIEQWALWVWNQTEKCGDEEVDKSAEIGTLGGAGVGEDWEG